ncbi:hypothetical protein C8Q70DRAFT_208190 [Cubamyces menziesii]|nr:hypothetical protein C8Q70DRAFT_208190 [Cubamyces menziesii]
MSAMCLYAWWLASRLSCFRWLWKLHYHEPRLWAWCAFMCSQNSWYITMSPQWIPQDQYTATSCELYAEVDTGHGDECEPTL